MPKKLLQTIKNGTPANGEQTEQQQISSRNCAKKIQMINKTHNKLVLGQTKCLHSLTKIKHEPLGTQNSFNRYKSATTIFGKNTSMEISSGDLAKKKSIKQQNTQQIRGGPDVIIAQHK